MKKIFMLGLLATACSPTSPTSQTQMINGALAPAGQFASTVVYLLPDAQNHGDSERRCTGVKVSPRFLLTAAHCVIDETGLLYAPLNQANAKLEISNFADRDTTDTSLWHSGSIKNIRTTPGYEDAVINCAVTGTNVGDCRNNWDIPAELALVEFNADLPAQWPSAQIDLHPVWVGERLALVGYGHQQSRYAVEPRVKKKYSYEIVRDWDEETPVMAEADAPSLTSSMRTISFTTFGAMHPSADIGSTAGLMPGDSGGPVYRGANTVVGIHRAVYFDGNDQPLFHIHSRLDTNEDFLRHWLPASSFAP